MTGECQAKRKKHTHVTFSSLAILIARNLNIYVVVADSNVGAAAVGANSTAFFVVVIEVVALVDLIITIAIVCTMIIAIAS